MAIVPGGAVSIAAAAITDVGQYRDRSSIDLAKAALTDALHDADLELSDIDGLVWNLGTSLGANYDKLSAALGLRPRFVVQTWTHGRFTGTCVTLGAMAIASGAATTLACLGGIKASPTPQTKAMASPCAGIDAFVRPAATALARYLATYPVDRGRLADVVITARRYGAMNPRAWLRDNFTDTDYRQSPTILDPLKVADCFPTDESASPINDSGVCVLLTDARQSRPSMPVYVVAGQTVQAGPEEVYFGRPGLGQIPSDFRPTARDMASFAETGLAPRDVDGFYTYDAFSPAVWFALERFGYCPPGEAPLWATSERMWLDGELPVNTNGGMLAAGHTSGWGQIVEMVDQLRGRAGPRQIRDAEVLHWGTVFGDSVILTNDLGRCARHV